LRSLADFHDVHQRFTRSYELLDHALHMSNLPEDLHCQAMRVYAALGNRAGLVQQYQELKLIISGELNVEPTQSSAKLYKTIKGQTWMQILLNNLSWKGVFKHMP